MKITKYQLKVINKYLQIAKKLQVHPSLSQMRNAGVSRNRIRDHFGSFSDLKTFVQKHYATELKSVLQEELYSKQRIDELSATLKKSKRFVITTAVTGASVHKGFLAAIDNYCEKNAATLLILLAQDPASKNKHILDPALVNRNLVLQDVALNHSLFLSTIKLSAKHIEPITGLARIGQKNGSFIYASPKQRMEPVANSNTKLPNILMTTGAITRPNYQTARQMSERTAYIANHDHVMGALIVEIEDKKIFHYRQVQANALGHFADWGKLYKDKEVLDFAPVKFVLGDWHSGETDPKAKAAWISITKELKIPELIIHDGFNGKSINHHEIRNKISRARSARENKLGLEDELRGYAADLDELSDLAAVTIVRSNHDDFLNKYLQESYYVEDPQNYYIASKLVTATIEGKDPLKHAITDLIGLKNPGKVLWLNRDQDYKVANIELGAHGDKGANGSRGSIGSMEKAYGASVSGHSHTPRILRNTWSVGTSSYLKLNYNVGPSSWMHSSCLVYPNGMRQLINSIEGKYKL